MCSAAAVKYKLSAFTSLRKRRLGKSFACFAAAGSGATGTTPLARETSVGVRTTNRVCGYRIAPCRTTALYGLTCVRAVVDVVPSPPPVVQAERLPWFLLGWSWVAASSKQHAGWDIEEGVHASKVPYFNDVEQRPVLSFSE